MIARAPTALPILIPEANSGRSRDSLAHEWSPLLREHHSTVHGSNFYFIDGHVGAAVHAAITVGGRADIYTTGEDLALPFAAFLRLRRWRGRLVCVFHNLTPRKRFLLQVIGHRYFHRIVVVSKKQRDLLVERCGIDPNKIVTVRNWVDTEFYQPSTEIRSDDYLIACGSENRDYETLELAAEKISAKIRVFGHGFFEANTSKSSGNQPHNIEYNPRVTYSALREAYARSTGVVLPLNNVEYAAGVTGLVEAMAMGKPVIVSRSEGISDYIGAIDPGLVVEPGDVTALAGAMTAVTTDRSRFDKVGTLNRAWAVTHCSLDGYAARIAAVLAPGA